MTRSTLPILLGILSWSCVCAEVPKAGGKDLTPLARVSANPSEGSALVALSVKDLEASKRWYAKVLGASIHYEYPPASWCELSTPVANTFIGLNGGPGATPGTGSASVSFGVVDIEKAKAWLVQNHVTIDGDIVEIPETVKLLSFQDPDGNSLMFYQPYVAPKQ